MINRDYCRRCKEERPREAEETHEDPDAEKGESRTNIYVEDGQILVRKERYTCTGWSEDSEEWKWKPSGGGTAFRSEEIIDDLNEATVKWLTKNRNN